MTDDNIKDADASAVVAEKKPVKRSAKPVATTKADEAIATNGTVLFMTSKGGSWTTPSGVTFSKDKPYQFVPPEEIESLLVSGRFRRAEPLEVKNFYKIDL
jgi:hypothetical protein